MLPAKWRTGLKFKSGPDNRTTHQKTWDTIQRVSKEGINFTNARLEWLLMQLFNHHFYMMTDHRLYESVSYCFKKASFILRYLQKHHTQKNAK